MSNTLVLPIILQLVGVAIIIAESILPSGGILSLVALAVFGYSLFTVFSEISVAAGFVFVAADLILIPVLVIVGLKLMAKSPVTLRTTLSSEDGVSVQSSVRDRRDNPVRPVQRLIERAWVDFSRSVTPNGLSRAEFESLVIQGCAIDGEVFVMPTISSAYKYGIAFNTTRYIRSYPVGICVHAMDLLLHSFLVITKEYGIAEAFTHLCLPIGANQCGHFPYHNIGNGQCFAV